MTNWGWRRWTWYSFTSVYSSEEHFSCANWRLAFSLAVQIWFQGPSLQAVSPTLPPVYAFPPMHSLYPRMFIISAQLSARFSSWISTWPHEPYWGQRTKGEAMEAGGGWGGTSLPHLCCAADLGGLEPITKTHLEELGKNWEQEHLWIILLPFSLRKLCSLCPLTPSFFYYTLM